MILAKSASSGQAPVSLLGHTQDVLRCARFLFGSDNRVSQLGQRWLDFFQITDGQAFLSCLEAAVLFHDWGKAEQSWQDSLTTKKLAKVRHEHLSGLLLTLPQVQSWLQRRNDIDWDVVLAAVISHHLKARADSFAERPAENAWLQLLVTDRQFCAYLNFAGQELGLAGTLPEIPAHWDFDKPCTFHLTPHIEKFKKRLRDFDDNLVDNEQRRRLLWGVRSALIAADAAGSALVRVGHNLDDWLKAAFDQEKLCTRLAIEEKIIKPRVESLRKCGRFTSWHKFQEQCDSLADRALLLAPCGAGKTLGAWRWIASQLEKRPVARVIFLYPTRATATEGFRDYVSWAPEDEAALIHGTAGFDLDGMFATPDDPGDPRRTKQFEIEEKLFALGFWDKRIFSATVDQFLGFLQYAYGSVCQLPLLVDSVLVIDEVHSFDRKMFAALKDFLRTFHVRVLCLTATLTRDRQEELAKCGLQVCADRPDDLQAQADAPRYQVRRLTQAEAEARVRQALAEGKKVLWVLNTVRRAQEAVQRLAEKLQRHALTTCGGLPLYCYHSRFKLEDRRQRHQEVVRTFQSGQGAVLAITTQVCEMSLDLDADLLVTEDCPVTSLIQRMGRCHRKYPLRAGAGEVLVYQPEQIHPYRAADLTGLSEFLTVIANGEWIGQSRLEAALQTIPLPPVQADVACRFLASGPYARAHEESFRDIDEFTVPALLRGDQTEYLSRAKERRAGLVVPVPRKFGRPWMNHQIPNYLHLAEDAHYHPQLGFCDQPLPQLDGDVS